MKRRIRTAVVLLGMTVGALVTGVPAAQAYPTCDGTKEVFVGSHFFSAIVPAHTGGTGTLDCEMGVGNQSWGVVVLQLTLNKCYSQHITVDGIYGQQTRQAVANAQTWEREAFHRPVSTDGVYGPETRRAMHWYGEQTGQGGTNPINICMRLDGTRDIR
jgi:hypothetical protein